MMNRVALILLAIAIGAFFFGAYLVSLNFLTITHYPSSIPSFVSSSQTTDSNLGLKLVLSTNSTDIRQGQSILLNVTVYNMLPNSNNVSAVTWANPLTIGPCPSNSPLGFKVFQGYYTSVNISSAVPLDLSEPGTYNCQTMLNVTSYVFDPLSNNATLVIAYYNGTTSSYQCCEKWPVPDRVFTDFELNHFWNDQNNEISFGPGIYTILGGDEWGQTTLLHFIVLT